MDFVVERMDRDRGRWRAANNGDNANCKAAGVVELRALQPGIAHYWRVEREAGGVDTALEAPACFRSRPRPRRSPLRFGRGFLFAASAQVANATVVATRQLDTVVFAATRSGRCWHTA